MTRRTAIVVDDHAHMRAHLIERLQPLDFEIHEAEHGMHALRVLGDTLVDLVLTDLVMPEMDGMELCEEIRRRPDLRRLPIVVASTHRDARYVMEALRKGADDFVSKPVSQNQLEKVIRRVMSHV
ncbi:MAG: response regulator [Myxococcales bacterium]|nr:response regulator [Myxococcales bacterium]MDD9969134.1 response regulator [Myxococcales bacterium]